MRGSLFNLAAPQFAFYQGVPAVIQMQDDVGLQVVAVAIVGYFTSKRSGIDLEVAHTHTLEYEAEGVELALPLTRAKAEADERVRIVQEQADKAMDAMAEEANAKVLATQNELVRTRKVLADEREKKDEDIRRATERAANRAWESANKSIQEAVVRPPTCAASLTRPRRTWRPPTARSTGSRAVPTIPPSSPTPS